MAVQQHDPAKPVRDEVVDQVAQQVEISPGRGRKRAGKVEMVMRVSQPEQGRPDDPVAQPLGDACARPRSSNMLSVKTGKCRPCCSTAAMGTTTGTFFETAAIAGQLNS